MTIDVKALIRTWAVQKLDQHLFGAYEIDESSVTIEFVESETIYGCCGDSDEIQKEHWAISGMGKIKRSNAKKWRPIGTKIAVEDFDLEKVLTEILTANNAAGMLVPADPDGYGDC